MFPRLSNHRHGSTAVMLVLLASVAASCDKKDKAAPKPAATSSAFTEADKVALMEKHYTAAISAHDALIRGQLPTLREKLADLSSQALPDRAPANWKPMHQQMRNAANSAKSTKTAKDASVAMAAVVESCGTCHKNLAQGPVYQKPAPAEGGTKLETEMRHHQWATERLWEGVTGPWSDAWIRGAKAMAKTDVFQPDSGSIGEELRKKEASLRKLGEEAQKAKGLHERAGFYGKILATCADCHGQVGFRMKPGK